MTRRVCHAVAFLRPEAGEAHASAVVLAEAHVFRQTFDLGHAPSLYLMVILELVQVLQRVVHHYIGDASFETIRRGHMHQVDNALFD